MVRKLRNKNSLYSTEFGGDAELRNKSSLYSTDSQFEIKQSHKPNIPIETEWYSMI